MHDIVKIEPYLLLCQAITFAIAVAILWKFAWGPLVAAVKGRQLAIKESIDSAEQTKAAVVKLEAEYKARMQQIQDQSLSIINQAKLDGQRLRDEILAAAKTDAEAVRGRMQEQLKHDRDAFAAQLRTEVVALSMAVAQKVVRDAASLKLQSAEIDEIVGAVEKEFTIGKPRE
jgi:F-type H+-transporting ATPase subunit b